MRSNWQLLYSFIWVPLKSSLKFIGFTFSVFAFFMVLSTTLVQKAFWDQDIFKVTQQDIAEILHFKPNSNTLIFDKKGKLISEQFNQYHHYTPFKEIPPQMIDAIIAVEDRKFFDHPGVDVFGILRAMTSYLKSSNNTVSQGASTITQQVVKNLVLSSEKTFERKLREIILALYLEQNISKEKILEIYCNHIFLGNGAYGVAAASKRYFNKNLAELSIAESALIAGLFQSPGKYNPLISPELARARQLQVLKAMFDAGKISKVEYAFEKATPLEYHEYKSLHGKIAPYYVDYVIKQAQEILKETQLNVKDSGLKIYTVLDQNLQTIVDDTFNHSTDVFQRLDKHIINAKELPQEKLKSEAAMIVMDRRTGEILALKGGRDYNDSQFNRATDALRAPGSVFKPITYALALKEGHKWNDLHYVTPITIGNYRPRSGNTHLFSETTLLEAFYESINSPAVSIGNELGIKNVINFGAKLGIETPIKEEAATLLGSSEVTMLDMARVYSVFANQGQLVHPYAIERIEDSKGNIIFSAQNQNNQKIVLDQTTNELVVEGLKQVVNRGTGYHASHLKDHVAGKTGTSNQARDNWFCGFSDDLVIISWMGHDEQLPYGGYISASNTATILFSRVAEKTRTHLKTASLSQPKNVQVAHVNPKYGNLDDKGIPMYFPQDYVLEKKTTDLLFLEKGLNTRMDFDEF